MPFMERLNKYLAHAGVGSRRYCDDVIARGRVSIDGSVVREMGTRIDPETQQIYILVRQELYERLRALLDEGTVYTTAEMLDRVLADDDAQDLYLAELQKKYGGVP